MVMARLLPLQLGPRQASDALAAALLTTEISPTQLHDPRVPGHESKLWQA